MCESETSQNPLILFIIVLVFLYISLGRFLSGKTKLYFKMKNRLVSYYEEQRDNPFFLGCVPFVRTGQLTFLLNDS